MCFIQSPGNLWFMNSNYLHNGQKKPEAKCTSNVKNQRLNVHGM